MFDGLCDSLSRSLRAAALAAAICSRKAEDEDFTGGGADDPGFDAGGTVSFFAIGAKASPTAARGFEGLAASVLLAGFDGEAGFGNGGTEVFALCSFVANDELTLLVELTLLRLPPGVKPKPPREVRDAGLALAGAFFAEGMAGLTNEPSLVPGRLLTLLA